MPSWLLIAALAAAQPAEPAQPDLDWLAGYWLHCEEELEVAETWSNRRGSVMLGTGITIGNDAFSWEQMRIEAEGEAMFFHAQRRGQQEPVAFRLVRSGPGEAVFENPEHDFPQRIIYRREGDRLTARVEALTGASDEGIEWQFRAAPFNARCRDRAAR